MTGLWERGGNLLSCMRFDLTSPCGQTHRKTTEHKVVGDNFSVFDL